jgi:formylglycine-generating enzyme required for sulfatase activity
VKNLVAMVLMLSLAGFAAGQERRIVPGPERGTVVLGSGGKRVAIVVGNDNYRLLPRLVNGVHDAVAIGAALREAAGFQVTVLTDASREAFEEGVNRFISSIQPGDVALFYYSGHGVQIGPDNYLLPVDLSAANEVQTRSRSLRVGEVVEEMESRGAALQIVILDACRDNPFGRERSIGAQRGLAAMNAGRGTFLAYATAPGKVADDGMYAKHLGPALRAPGLGIEQVFREVNRVVQQESGERVRGGRMRELQVPWTASSLDGEFYFVGGPAPAAQVDAALEAWNLVKASQRAEDFEEFAAAFPAHELAATAKLRAGQLRRAGAAAVATAPIPRPETGDSGGTTKVNPKDGLTYVRLRGGTFMMGCSVRDSECFDEEGPAHQVTITKGFWIGQTEVTQEAYQRVTGKNPSEDKGARLPVDQVTWDEAQAYCRAVGMRLPTEAEWEYAARGGDTSARYGPLDAVGWKGPYKMHEVGQKQANTYGLYDMLGNVSEWVADWYDGKYYRRSPAADPAGPASGKMRVQRGGPWGNNPRLARVSYRDMSGPKDRYFLFGFRCAGELP